MSVKFHDDVVPLLVPIDEIKPWPENPRSGDLGALVESIQKNGFYGAVVVQRSTNYVLAGNHRLAALTQMGEDQIPVVWVDVDDTEAARLALADNRTSDLAFYDDEALFALLDHLVSVDSLEGTGYDRAAYELLLQGVESDGAGVVGGVRQGMTPEDRIDSYNALDIRSLILPYEASIYEEIAGGLAQLRRALDLESNAEVVAELVRSALNDVEVEP